MMPTWPDRLRELLEKYTTLVRMRREREALERQGILRFEGEAATQRSTESAALAERFPGALRELDTLNAAALAQRLAAVGEALTSVAEGDPPSPLWLRVVADFHLELRTALSIKRWLADEGLAKAEVDPTIVARFERWYSGPVVVDPSMLARYQSPPSGRLSELVWQTLSERHSQPVAALKRLVFDGTSPEEP